jgi:formate hydrogenlyase subunit 6/NADH:ubiquinone oxidoreductase subunit I
MDKKLDHDQNNAHPQKPPERQKRGGWDAAQRLRTLAYLLPQVWSALRNGPRTVGYPFEPAEIPDGYRGRVRIHADRCRGCGLCVRDCPAFGLELERQGRDRFQLIYHPDRCAYCGQCEESCNFGAIYQDKEFVTGTPDRDNLTTVLVDRKPEPESS